MSEQTDETQAATPPDPGIERRIVATVRAWLAAEDTLARGLPGPGPDTAARDAAATVRNDAPTVLRGLLDEIDRRDAPPSLGYYLDKWRDFGPACDRGGFMAAFCRTQPVAPACRSWVQACMAADADYARRVRAHAATLGLTEQWGAEALARNLTSWVVGWPVDMDDVWRNGKAGAVPGKDDAWAAFVAVKGADDGQAPGA